MQVLVMPDNMPRTSLPATSSSSSSSATTSTGSVKASAKEEKPETLVGKRSVPAEPQQSFARDSPLLDTSSCSSTSQDLDEEAERDLETQAPKPERPEENRARKLQSSSDVEQAQHSTTCSKRLYVSNLKWQISEELLRSEFEKFGVVTEARVVRDRRSGWSRGFGFVSFDDDESAMAAMKALNGVDIEGRLVRIEPARSTGPLPRRSTNFFPASSTTSPISSVSAPASTTTASESNNNTASAAASGRMLRRQSTGSRAMMMGGLQHPPPGAYALSPPGLQPPYPLAFVHIPTTGTGEPPGMSYQFFPPNYYAPTMGCYDGRTFHMQPVGLQWAASIPERMDMYAASTHEFQAAYPFADTGEWEEEDSGILNNQSEEESVKEPVPAPSGSQDHSAEAEGGTHSKAEQQHMVPLDHCHESAELPRGFEAPQKSVNGRTDSADSGRRVPQHANSAVVSPAFAPQSSVTSTAETVAAAASKGGQGRG